MSLLVQAYNTLRPGQIDHHFADDIFKCIFLNANVSISIEISLKFILKGLINYIPALVKKMAWRWPGDKPLFEPMVVRLPMHIRVTLPQLDKSLFAILAWGNGENNKLKLTSKVGYLDDR